MIPKFVRNEVKAILSKPRGMYRLYSSNFSEEAWPYVKSLSDEDLFTICPPLTLRCKQQRKSQFKPSCKECGVPTKFVSYRSGYSLYCSSKCARTAYAREETPEHLESRIKAMQNTMLKRYGAHCSALAGLQSFDQLHTKQSRDKSRQTFLRNYGAPGNRTKAQQEKWDALKVKTNASLMETRLKTPGLYNKQLYQHKTVVVQGVSFSVQGYEGHVIKYLVNTGLTNVKSIEVSPAGFKYTEHGRTRAYLPDLRAKIANRWYIVEVKSTYTAGLDPEGKTMFYNLRRKSRAVVEAGHRMLTIIYLPKSKEIVEIENIHELSISQARQLCQA